MSETIVLGTRGSALALWQARHVAGRLRAAHPGLEVREVVIKTGGDLHSKIMGATSEKGEFVREIEDALLDDRIDFAVHSLKDLPTELPLGLALTAVPERHDARDALLTVDGRSVDELAHGTVVATGSFRRRCQLLDRRPDLELVPVRGNVDTRLRKLREGRFGALVLALAGIERLGLDDAPRWPIPTEICLPAVGQGALGIESRAGDGRVAGILAVLEDAPTRTAVTAERAFLKRLGGGCLAPATGFATLDGGEVELRAVVGDPDGRTMLRDRDAGPADRAAAIGERLADRLLGAGAGRILDEVRRAAERTGRP